MDFWRELGFKGSPYDTDPVPASDEGEKLLVGRDAELDRVRRYIAASALHPTIEGENGVGKTSLVAVAGHQLRRSFEAGESRQLIIPLGPTFQLSKGDTADAFERKVYYQVAQAFVEHRRILEAAALKAPDTRRVDKWLSQPLARGGGLGGSAMGFGAQGSAGSTPNTSTGFDQAGFQATVASWLTECFPDRATGAFLCVLDNLELLETSQAARSVLESLRDSVLSQTGLRWVLCGARGIVRTGASSPRLEGRLREPLVLRPIPEASVAEVVARRIEAYRLRPGARAPVGRNGFRHIYEILNGNLRNALKFADDYSFWLIDEGQSEKAGDPDLLEAWLSDTADRYVEDTTQVRPRAWELFEGIVQMDGSCSPSDYEVFGFNSSMAMRPHIKSLEDANLLQSSIDETDQRRKTISVTPRGWLVQYQRSGYQKPRRTASAGPT